MFLRCIWNIVTFVFTLGCHPYNVLLCMQIFYPNTPQKYLKLFQAFCIRAIQPLPQNTTVSRFSCFSDNPFLHQLLSEVFHVVLCHGFKQGLQAGALLSATLALTSPQFSPFPTAQSVSELTVSTHTKTFSQHSALLERVSILCLYIPF
jgi:hypothetical protein